MTKIKVLAAVTAFVAAAFLPSTADAECECRCMGGQNRPLCTSTMEIPPICAPTVCPIQPPALQPLMAPSLPPLGTVSCSMRQVYNPAARQYQWESICQ